MSALRSLVRGIAARTAGVLGLNRPAGHSERPGAASADTSASATARTDPVSERDLRDRERELRILMSNWM
jgi:hypothetical protein